jgi:hypothetical protein
LIRDDFEEAARANEDLGESLAVSEANIEELTITDVEVHAKHSSSSGDQEISADVTVEYLLVTHTAYRKTIPLDEYSLSVL